MKPSKQGLLFASMLCASYVHVFGFKEDKSPAYVPIQTKTDEERIAAAEAKRERKRKAKQ